MSDPKRVAERNAGAFIGPNMAIPAPMNADNGGPGKPGPGDKWDMPNAPVDAIAGQDDPTHRPAESDGKLASLPDPPRRG